MEAQCIKIKSTANVRPNIKVIVKHLYGMQLCWLQLRQHSASSFLSGPVTVPYCLFVSTLYANMSQITGWGTGPQSTLGWLITKERSCALLEITPLQRWGESNKREEITVGHTRTLRRMAVWHIHTKMLMCARARTAVNTACFTLTTQLSVMLMRKAEGIVWRVAKHELSRVKWSLKTI